MKYSIQLDLLVQLAHPEEIAYVEVYLLNGRVPDLFWNDYPAILDPLVSVASCIPTDPVGAHQELVVLIAGLSDVPAIKNLRLGKG